MSEIDFNSDNLAWDKMAGLLPAIIQHGETGDVLMLGYMDQAALQATLQTRRVTFFSRSKNRLWVKGETSGNYLTLQHIVADCDHDSLLITALPAGSTCHTGAASCFVQAPGQSLWRIITTIEQVIAERAQTMRQDSYTASLLNQGLGRISQKVGEEAVEVVIASLSESDPELCGEVADLFFHTLVLLKARQVPLTAVLAVLQERFISITKKQDLE